MKRYTYMITWDDVLQDDVIQLVEHPDGGVYLVTDVHREMIPRPDAEVARKAVGFLAYAQNEYLKSLKAPDELPEKLEKVKSAEAEVLRLMGAET